MGYRRNKQRSGEKVKKKPSIKLQYTTGCEWMGGSGQGGEVVGESKGIQICEKYRSLGGPELRKNKFSFTGQRLG